jgi:hypothetical protein
MTAVLTSRPLRAKINRLAHAQALQHEERLKTALLAKVLAAHDAGASFDQLVKLVDRLENQPAQALTR